MTSFDYKEIDHNGWETLDAISEAGNFNRWMYETIKPHCSGKVLEIGSGIGNISKYFVEDGYDITLSDVREHYCELLSKRFGMAQKVIRINIADSNLYSEHSSLRAQYDSIFALNVVEHIQDDLLAVRNCFELLGKNGKLIILVPAYQSLYNSFDRELEHYRRYTRRNLKQLLQQGGFKVSHTEYFNFLGIAGWFVSGNLQKNRIIPRAQMSFYNKLIPVSKLIDKLLLHSVGLSVIAVGIKE